MDDGDCDDGVYCNGIESCSLEASETSGECVAGTDPCTGATPECIEEGTGTCVECVTDANCDDGEICEADVCVASGTCPEGTPAEVVAVMDLFDKDGNCLLNKEELKAYNTSQKELHKQQKLNLKNEQSQDKTRYKLIKTNYSEK